MGEDACMETTDEALRCAPGAKLQIVFSKMALLKLSLISPAPL